MVIRSKTVTRSEPGELEGTRERPQARPAKSLPASIRARKSEPLPIGVPKEDAELWKNAEEYDYLYMGGGTAVTIHAPYLADHFKVAVFEQGGDEVSDESRSPADAILAKQTAPQELSYHVQHDGLDALDPSNDQGLGEVEPRAQAWGGCTVDNLMVWMTPYMKEYFDQVVQPALGGHPAWSGDNAVRVLKELQNDRSHPLLRALHEVAQRTNIKALQKYVDSKPIGFEGFIHTRQIPLTLAAHDLNLAKFLGSAALTITRDQIGRQPTLKGKLQEAGRQLLHVARRADPNIDPAAEGIQLIPMVVNPTGERGGPRQRFLQAAQEHPDRLVRHKHSRVDRVVFEPGEDGGPPKAVGIRVLQGENLEVGSSGPASPGKPKHKYYRARIKVLNGAGTFENPAILQRSGIGPAEHLRSIGAQVLVDDPKVGAGLMDRYEVPVVGEFGQPFSLAQQVTEPTNNPLRIEWEKKGTGPVGTNGITLGHTRKGQVGIIFPGNFKKLFSKDNSDILQGANAADATDLLLQMENQNKAGTVLIKSLDPQEPAGIRFNMFEQGGAEDREKLVDIHELGREIFRDAGAQEVYPGPQLDSREKLAQLDEEHLQEHHPMGSNQSIEWNGDQKGVQGLGNVGDASNLPGLPPGFIQAYLMVQARILAELELTEQGKTLKTWVESPKPPDTTVRRQNLAAAGLVLDAFQGNKNGIPERDEGAPGWLEQNLTDWKKVEQGMQARHGSYEVEISPDAKAVIPEGLAEHYRLTKTLQAKIANRPRGSISEGVVKSAGVQLTGMDGKVRNLQPTTFFQRMDPPAGVKPKGIVVALGGYEESGRFWTGIANELTLQGNIVLLPDHAGIGYSPGEPGALDFETCAAQAATVLRHAELLRKDLGLKQPVKALGESYGAGAMVGAAILANNGRLTMAEGPFPQKLSLGLINPYLGALAHADLTNAIGDAAQRSPIPLPSITDRPSLTNVYRDPEARKRQQALADLENIRTRAETLASGKGLLAAARGVQDGSLQFPKSVDVSVLLSTGDHSVDRAETSAFLKAIRTQLVGEPLMFDAVDHALLLNTRAQPLIVQLAGDLESKS